MDYGSLLGTTFTCPTPVDLERDPEYLKHLLTMNRWKMLLVKKACENIKENHRCIRRMNLVAIKKRRVVSVYTLKLRMSISESFLHLLNRYLVMVWRDCMTLMTMLSGPQPSALHVALRQSHDRVIVDPPNIHGHFVWADSYRDSSAKRVEETARLHVSLRMWRRQHSTQRDQISYPEQLPLGRPVSEVVALPAANQSVHSSSQGEEMEVPRLRAVSVRERSRYNTM